MRIISGIYKSRKIVAPKNLPVRPTTDMAKESLFNIINNNYYFDDVSVFHIPSSHDTICYGESIKFIAPTNTQNIWSVKGDFDDVISTDPMIEVDPINDMSLIFEGDSTFIEKNVVVNACPQLIMPNVFSPNKDQINDYFVPVIKKNVKNIQVTILNRWGEIVFQTDNLTNGWDGTLNGNLCSDGIYFWTLKCQDVFDSPLSFHGTVSLFGSDN